MSLDRNRASGLSMLAWALTLVTGAVCSTSTLEAEGADRASIPLWEGETPEPRVLVTEPEKNLPSAPGAPVITRATNIVRPQLVVFEAPADRRTGTAAIVVPGGGFRYLTVDLEGSEACEWLNTLGITAFLLRHRAPTHEHAEPNLAVAQDAQRAIQVVRSRAAEWGLKSDRIGLLGFSAGGQVALRAATNEPLWTAGPAATSADVRPDFLLLVYPWGLYDPKAKALRTDIHLTKTTPPTFLAQAGDDKSSLAQGSALVYLQLLELNVPAELHIYERGGHGFGLRASPSPATTDWTLRAKDWLKARGL